jgi:hypothetical protein
VTGVTDGAAARRDQGTPAPPCLPDPCLPPQVTALRVVREANDGYRERVSYTDAAAALEAVRAFMAVPGTYQITIFFVE